jgi:hypothetical protein
MTELVGVRYIGKKAVGLGTVAKRKDIIWQGYGDVQKVEPVAAKRLMDFPTVFIHEDDEWVKNPQKAEVVSPQAEEAPPAETVKRHGLEPVAKEEPEEEKPVIQYDKRQEGITKAIRLLDEDNPEHYSSRGKPKVAAVNAIFSENATAAEVEAAFKLIKGE